MTCFNRKEKTVRCLRRLFAAEEYFNVHQPQEHALRLAVYLTDDGCTDGTADAVEKVCEGHELHIIQGDGHCYWAGGMRLAWAEALRQQERWAFYALVNDDTYALDDAFVQLFDCHRYAVRHYGKGGIYSGITRDPQEKGRITYGGYVWTNFLLGRDRLLEPTGKPQQADKANTNLTLVERNVVERLGMFWQGYVHTAADYDYSMMARKAGLPVLVTPQVAAECEYDHRSNDGVKEKVLSMTLAERKAYFNHPLHCSKDVLLLKRRCTPIRYPLGWLGRTLNVYAPRLYYRLSDRRNEGMSQMKE